MQRKGRHVATGLAALVAGITVSAGIASAEIRLQLGRSSSSLSTASTGDGASGKTQPSFPIRAAFYYPWFPETWTVGGEYAHYRPSLGYYSTTSVRVQRAHITALTYAGMNAAISEWTPPPHYRNARLRALLAQTVRMRSALRWSIYYSPEGKADPSPAEIASNLAYVRDSLAVSPAYLRVGGRFVVFVWSRGGADHTCSLADRWREANALIGNAAYVVLKVFEGYRSCSSQPDSWHQYGPAVAVSLVAGHSYAISPGFWKADEVTPRLGRDLARFTQSIRAMIASKAPWQLVTTFNEWGEGTQVESSTSWATASGMGAYVDALHRLLGRSR